MSDSEGARVTRLARDQAIFISSFFIVFGWIMNDAYYSTFGIKYQFFGIEYSHIVYRGFTLLYFNIYFFTVLILILFAIGISFFDKRNKLIGYAIPYNFVSYSILAFALIFGCFLSYRMGIAVAVSDMYANTTTLRQIVTFSSPSEKKSDFVNGMIDSGKPILLLNTSSTHELIMFVEPALRVRLPRIEIFHVRIEANDTFSDRAPLLR